MAAIELYSTPLFSDANLISYWRMEANSNDSKDGNNGTDTAITYSAGNGKFGQGAGFNGTTSVIDPSNNTNMRFTGNFTVGAWFRMASNTGNYAIFTMYTQNPNVAGYGLGVNLTAEGLHKLGAISGDNIATHATVVGATTVDDGNYHLGIFTWNGSNITLYTDGGQDGQTAYSTAPAYAAVPNCRIGAEVAVLTPAKFWPGQLDDVFVMSRALTPTEISNLYNGTWLSKAKNININQSIHRSNYY